MGSKLKSLFYRNGRGWARYFVRLFTVAVIAFVGVSLLITIIFRFANPPITPLMVKMAFAKHSDGSRYGVIKSWKDLDEISPQALLAVVASEDNRFLEHHGFDLKAIKEAQEHNKKGKRKRGASTISMQTAKNVFLWDGRNYLRKGLEVWFTVLIEVFWGKERIMEVYLNVIEMGQGIYGIEAAAQKYYRIPASKLSRGQSAMIATILPNPRQRDPRKPSSYMYQRQKWVLWNMNNIEVVDFNRREKEKD